MAEQTQFQNFSNNTKFTCMMISVALLILIITTIAPSSPDSISNKIGKLCAIALLGYALATNCQETTQLTKNIPDLFTDSNLTGIRNNTLLSYILSFIMLIAIVYVIFTFF
jgi:hypothetical protein